MAQVRLTQHLFAFFPALEGRDITIEASTVADIIDNLEDLAPGIAFYICDERGRLRQHVNIFIDEEPVSDRHRLTDPVPTDSTVSILQALSGGAYPPPQRKADHESSDPRRNA